MGHHVGDDRHQQAALALRAGVIVIDHAGVAVAATYALAPRVRVPQILGEAHSIQVIE